MENINELINRTSSFINEQNDAFLSFVRDPTVVNIVASLGLAIMLFLIINSHFEEGAENRKDKKKR